LKIPRTRGNRFTLSYAFNAFEKSWKDWRWYYFQFTNLIVSKYFTFKSNNGTYLLNENWDNLIILDACRYDVFEEKYKNLKVRGILEKRISRGSATREFLIENFKDRYCSNIVYITTNPFVYTALNDPFFKTIHLWKSHWDNKTGTVLPEQVVKKAIEVYKLYPDKKLIIHFMQPHCPFIGKYKKEGNFWQIALSEGKEEVMKLYKANLDSVLPYVEYLLTKFEGKTIVTADHGEACGEGATPLRVPIYGHPMGVHIPALIEVPWFVVDNGSKKIRVKRDDRTNLKRNIIELVQKRKI